MWVTGRRVDVMEVPYKIGELTTREAAERRPGRPWSLVNCGWII